MMSMRNILGNILLCCVLALCCPVMSSAQAGGYDKALDKYADICDRCLELRDLARSGQNVGENSLKSLLEELAALRKTLSGASGRMSAAQASRFEEIKARYRHGVKSSVGSLLKRAEPLPRLASLPVAEPVEAPGNPLASLVHHDTSASSVSGKAGALSPVSGKNGTLVGSLSGNRTSSHGLEVLALADIGMFPTPSYGATAAVLRHGIGAYASFRSNFRKNEYSYTCASDGSAEYGRIWTTGRSRVSRTVATAGFAMSTSRRFGFRLGAGLTSYTRCWEDVSGQWAKVDDKSFSGLAADAGIFIAFKPLLISLGATSDFSGHVDLQLGLGICF